MNTEKLFDKLTEELKNTKIEDVKFPFLFSVGVPNENLSDPKGKYKTAMFGSEQMIKDMLTSISSEPVMRNAIIGASIEIIREYDPLLALAIASTVKLLPTSDNDGVPCDCEECNRRRKEISPSSN